MASILDQVIGATTGGVKIVSENHDVSTINFVNGLSDPGEMIRCGYLPELRRESGESDADYAARIRPLVAKLSESDRNRIMGAAINRASLDTSNGRVNVMVVGEPAWHQLGVNVQDAVRSAEALVISGQNWKAVKVQSFYDFAGVTHEDDGMFVIVRDDTGKKLSNAGSKYEPLQNVDAYAIVDDLLVEVGAKYHTAGCTNNGRETWIQAELPNGFKLPGGDENKAFLTLTNSFVPGTTVKLFATNHRVVCQNTKRVAVNADGADGLTIRHTGDMKAKAEAARESLGLAVQGYEDFKARAEVAYRTPCEISRYAPEVLDVVLGVTTAQKKLDSLHADPLASVVAVTEAESKMAKLRERKENVLEEILEAYNSETCEAARGTAWGAYNAVSQALEHGSFAPGKRGTTHSRLSKKMESTLSGEVYAASEVAWKMAMA
jgi:phage/plasmid-like protein (TIGR03299 family)